MKLTWLEIARAFRVGWRVAPGYSLATLLVMPTISIATAGIAVAQRAIVDSGPDDDPVRFLVVAALGGVAFAALLSLARLQGDLRGVIRERSIPELNVERFELIDNRARFEDAMSDQYADKQELMRRHLFWIPDLAWGLYATVFVLFGTALSIWLLLSIDLRLFWVAVGAALSLVVALIGAQRGLVEEDQLAILRREERQLHESCVHAASVQETRSYGAESYLDTRADDLWQKIANRVMRIELINTVWSGASMIFVAIALVFGVMLLSQEIEAGHHTAGDLVLLVTIAVGLRQQLQETVTQFDVVRQGYTAVGALAYTRANSRPEHRETTRSIELVEHGIHVRNLEFTYAGSDSPSLRGVNVDIPAGTVLAIVGRNGAGKSTLANLLLGILTPTRGSIHIDGEHLEPESWRPSCTGAFQDFIKPRFTLREAIGLGDTTAIGDEARLRKAVEDAGGSQLLASLPIGLDTSLTQESGVTLSHGQWQTVALARSHVPADPMLTVLDEPTSALDAHAEHELFTSFIARGREAGAHRGTISVVISHRYSAAYLADLIVVVEDGQAIEQGTHAELMNQGGEYRRMYDLQRAAYLE